MLCFASKEKPRQWSSFEADRDVYEPGRRPELCFAGRRDMRRGSSFKANRDISANERHHYHGKRFGLGNATTFSCSLDMAAVAPVAALGQR